MKTISKNEVFDDFTTKNLVFLTQEIAKALSSSYSYEDDFEFSYDEYTFDFIECGQDVYDVHITNEFTNNKFIISASLEFDRNELEIDNFDLIKVAKRLAMIVYTQV